MKIYVAGSYAARTQILLLGSLLRAYCFDCYVFCDAKEEAHGVSVRLRVTGETEAMNPKLAMLAPKVQKIYELDSQELATSDALILVLPSGRSAHLEAGWMAGRGKPVIVFGGYVKGEWDAMYGMATRMFDEDEIGEMLKFLALLKDTLGKRQDAV